MAAARGPSAAHRPHKLGEFKTLAEDRCSLEFPDLGVLFEVDRLARSIWRPGRPKSWLDPNRRAQSTECPALLT
jgi:hypothetical protein